MTGFADVAESFFVTVWSGNVIAVASPIRTRLRATLLRTPRIRTILGVLSKVASAIVASDRRISGVSQSPGPVRTRLRANLLMR